MLRIRGSFFVILAGLCFSGVFAQEPDVVFDRIVVTKKEKEANFYTVSADNLQFLPFGSPVESLSISLLNLQARSPVESIQADFSLRGSNYEGVRVLLNGQSINDPQTGHHNADIPFTKEDIAGIDVFPGISLENFGPGSIGGAVNFIIKRPEGKGVIFELSGGEYGSYGQLLSLRNRLGNLGLRATVENKGSRGFSEDTDFKKFTANIASSLELSNGSFDIDFGYQDKEFGAYDFYTPGKGYPSKEWTKTYLLSSTLNLKENDLDFKPAFLWRRHFDKFMLDKTQLKSNYLACHRTDIYTPGIYLSKENTFIGKVGLGVEYSYEKISSTTLGSHSRDQKSLFINDEAVAHDRFFLNTIFRIDDYDRKDTYYTGAMKLSFEALKGLIMHLGISRSIRIPTFTELYYNDPTTEGSAGLSAEKSFTYDAGLSYKDERWSLSSVFFLRDEDNLIDWVKSSPFQKKWQAQNISSSVVFGLEESAQYAFNSFLTLKANYAYTNRQRDDNGYIYKYGENYSRHLTSLISIFRFGFGVQELGITYKKTPSRSGWLLAHAKLNYNLNKNARFFISATNIFNVEYQEIEGIPSPGRWVEGGVRIEW